MNSNTNGSHGKQCLDSNKLNPLKVLVFSKSPVESATKKHKLWAFIKTKITARCRAIKYEIPCRHSKETNKSKHLL